MWRCVVLQELVNVSVEPTASFFRAYEYAAQCKTSPRFHGVKNLSLTLYKYFSSRRISRQIKEI